MSLVDRAKNIITTPKTEWPVIAAEPATVQGLFTGYAIPLSLLPVVGGVLGLLIKGLGFSSFFLGTILIGWAINLGILYLMIIIADALAPSFDGQRSQTHAAKLLIYAATPVWVVGFITGLLPLALLGLGFLLGLLGYVWTAYLIYLGATAVVGVPQAKAIGYTAVVIIIWIVLSLVIGGIIVTTLAATVFGAAMSLGAAGAL